MGTVGRGGYLGSQGHLEGEERAVEERAKIRRRKKRDCAV